MKLIAVIFIAILLFELIIFWLSNSLRKKFQWIITTKDEFPNFDQNALNQFIENKYSPELGWIMKPNMSGKESVGSLGALGGHNISVEYHINNKGARFNPGNEHKKSIISVYGDSYAFCRQVSDNESWEWCLSKMTNSNVLNFGVGNYGIDQALIRLKKEYDENPTDVVILEAVPETIVRILSVWKHYYEYGNIFAFKPIYSIENNELILIDNFINNKEKFESLREYLPQIQEHDYFYINKFNKYRLRFPYIFHFFKHPIRNISLFSTLIIRGILRKFKINYDTPWKIILNDNATYCKAMYQETYAINLLIGIIKEFIKYSKEKGFKPILLILPFEEDLRYFKKNNNKYYQFFLDEVSNLIKTIDLTDELSQNNQNLFTNKFYGSHVNKVGNEIIANYIFTELKKSNII